MGALSSHLHAHFWLACCDARLFGVFGLVPCGGSGRPEAFAPASHSLGRGLRGRDRPHDTGLQAGGHPQDYIRTARANGLREWVVIYSTPENAMIP